MNNNNNNFSNNKYNIDNRIIPLFNVPITMKKIFEGVSASNNYTDLNKQTEAQSAILQTVNTQTNTKGNINREMINLYSKALNKYNSGLEESNISTLKLNKINLIEEIKEESNNINSIYKNYLYLINRYLPYYVYYNSFFKLGLFLPEQLFKPQFYTYKYKGLNFYFNILPGVNLREYTKIFNKGFRNLIKLPFIKKNSLRRIIKGKISLLLLSSSITNSNKTSASTKTINRINLIEKYFTLNTDVKDNCNNIIKKRNRKLLVDNNFLPVKSNRTSLIVEETAIIKNTCNNKIFLIWQDKEVKILLNNIIEKGDSLIKQLNSLIIEKQSFINNNKVNNLFSSIDFNSSSESTPLINLALANTGEEVISTKNGNENNSPIINQYLKSMSIYNMKKKGILIHYNNLVNYNFVKGSLGSVNKLIFKVHKLLEASFKSMYCLISKPLFIITADKITIRLFYFLFVPNFLKYKKLVRITEKGFKGRMNKNRVLGSGQAKKQFNKFRKLKQNVRIKLRNLSNVALTKVFSNKFKILTIILSKLFKKPVEFDLTRLHYCYNDSNILVNLLGIMINKIKLRIIIRRLFEKAVIKNLNKLPLQRSSSAAANLLNKEGLSENNLNWKDSVNIPAFLSGIKIKVGGRLLTQSVVPRQTVNITQRGATQRGKINFLDVARYTRKNKRGAFSITIKSGQNLF